MYMHTRLLHLKEKVGATYGYQTRKYMHTRLLHLKENVGATYGYQTRMYMHTRLLHLKENVGATRIANKQKCTCTHDDCLILITNIKVHG